MERENFVLVLLTLNTVFVTAFLWIKLRGVTRVRPWLFLKVTGNLVLVTTVVANWLVELSAEAFFISIGAAFGLWGLGLVKLIPTVRKEPTANQHRSVDAGLQRDQKQ